jgi:hypothetical protein
MTDHDASALPRLVQCGASKSMPGYTPTPGMETDDEERQIGIAAHWLAMSVLRGNISDPFEYADRKSPNGVYISPEMAQHVDDYVTRIRARRGEHRAVELPISCLIADGVRINCRPDSLIDDYARNIYIDDFKYGWRLVEAEMNWTLIAYAIAHLSTHVIGPETLFHFTIHQPRPYHMNGPVRMWTITAAHMHDLTLTLRARLTMFSDTLQTGPNCYKCPALGNCPSARHAGLNAIDVAEQMFDEHLPSDTLSAELDEIERAQRALKMRGEAIEELLYHRATNGESVKGRHLMPNVGPLEWHEYVTADMLRMLTNKPVSREKLITPTQAKKLLPESVIDKLADRPKKGMKLVRIDAQKLAQRMFGKGT